jgi:NTE family protein
MGDFRSWVVTVPAETALVFSGGGAFGAFAVGVLKTLFAGRSPATGYRSLEADILTGTSVGAFNAAMLAGAAEPSALEAAMHLESIWLERVAEKPQSCGNGIFRVKADPSDYLNAGCWLSPARLLLNFVNDGINVSKYCLDRSANFLASDLPARGRLAGLFNAGSFIDNTAYYDLLHEVIDEENIHRSKKRITIVATGWVAGTPQLFRNSEFKNGMGINVIMASTAIPGIFPPVKIGSDVFVDGGASENTPLHPAIDLGATELHAIYLDPRPQYIPLLGEPNTLDTMLRVYHVMLNTKINEDIKTARWINQGLSAISALRDLGTLSATQSTDLIRVAGKILQPDVHYKPITVHRYFPRATHPGRLGLLDFTLEAIVRLIKEGERAALLHDCAENDCVLPHLSESARA